MSTHRLIEQETPFGMTVGQHLEEAMKWLNTRSERLHHEGCSYHAPSARCNCGLHKTKTDLMAVQVALKEQEQAGERKPLTDEQIDRHSIAAVDCPPSSTVILVSSLRRLLGITATKGNSHA